MVFRLKKDWYLETNILGVKNRTLIFPEGHEFEPNDKGEYHIIYGGWSESNTSVGGRMILDIEKMKLGNDNGVLLFETIEKQDINIIIEEIPDNDDEIVKKWRIQLDVNTTRKKLKEIEKFINDNIIKML